VLVEVDRTPLLEDVFEDLIEIGVEEEFALLFGDNVFRANLGEVVTRLRVGGSDAA
jgi:dTDP-glucose pyrophosphorylase